MYLMLVISLYRLRFNDVLIAKLSYDYKLLFESEIHNLYLGVYGFILIISLTHAKTILQYLQGR